MEPQSVENVEQNVEIPSFTSEQKDFLRTKVSELINKIIADKIEVVVFLDKSARPLEWLMLEGWSTFGNDHPLPKIRFINIGTEKQDIHYYNPPTNEEYPALWIRETANYRYPINHQDNNYFQKMQSDLNKETEFSGKFLLVDEFRNLGKSLKMAEKFFHYYFPQSTIENFVFFQPRDEKVFPNPHSGYAGMRPHLPWYPNKQVLVKDSSDNRHLLSQREDNVEKRLNGLALRKRIKEVFIDQQS